jgi:DNA-3-methyladenine glycosylase
LYVYFTYGMHFCSNVVTGHDGVGSAVLLRAAEPIEGLDVMAANRGVEIANRLCGGPGRLTQAFGIGRAENGVDLVRDDSLHLRAGEPVARSRIARTTRVGVNVGIEPRWRFFERGSGYVSPGRPSAVPGSVTGSRRS